MNFLRSIKWVSGQPTSGRRSPRRRTWLSVEALESRVTPSVLTVNGDTNPNPADVITVDVNSAGGIQLTLDGKISEFSRGEFSSVVVNPGGGDNVAFLNALPANVPLTINSAAGATDIVLVGSGNLSSLASGVTINGNGKDLVGVQDQDNNNPGGFTDYTVTSNSVTWEYGVIGSPPSTSGGLTYSGVAKLSIEGGSTPTRPGGVGYQVYSTAAGTSLAITLGSDGEDQVNLGGSNGVSDLAGPITVNGPTSGSAGNDSIQLFDDGNATGSTFTFTSTTVSRPSFGGLTYNGIAAVTFDVGFGSDTFNIDGNMAGTTLTIQTLPLIFVRPDAAPQVVGGASGGSVDTFNLGTGNLDAIQGKIDLAVQQTSVLNIDDQASTSVRVYGLHNSVFAWSGSSGGVDFSGGSSMAVTINGGSAADTYDFLDTASGNTYTINAGTAANTIILAGGLFLGGGNLDQFHSPVTVNGGGSSTVAVDDQANTAANNYIIDGTSLERDGSSILTASGIASLTLNGSTNAGLSISNSCTIESTALGVPVIVNGGGPEDHFFVSPTAQNLSTLAAPLTINGAGALDFLTFNDQAATAAEHFTVTSSSLTRSGAAAITYSGMSVVSIFGGSHKNSFAVPSLQSGGADFFAALDIHCGSGGDTITAGNASDGLDDFQGSLTVTDDLGRSTLTLNDQSTSAPQTYSIFGSIQGEDIARSGVGVATVSGKIRSLTINGGSGGNDFVDTLPPTSLVTINGGSGSNTLSATQGAGHITGWAITGSGSGHVGKLLFFTGMHDLVGMSGVDDFQFFAGGSIAGTISGGSGLGNELSYAHEAGPVTVNLQTDAAPQVNGGAAGGFSGITIVQGSTSAANTLIGPDADTTWTVSKANAGSGSAVGLTFSFSQFQNLVGGSGVDVFKFTASGSLAGTLDGGTAPLHEGNWLDYSALTTAVTVNLQTGAATAVAGGVSNIQNVHGGNGGNTLTGDAQGNILIGGTGNDIITGGTGASILIGDAGADQITGGSGNDILIGDTTLFDTMTGAHEAALMSILAEWQSADSYATRFTDINTGTGGGLNGTAKLNFGTTVLKDGSADVLTAASSAQAQDWFFQGPGDTLQNVEAGEHINNS